MRLPKEYIVRLAKTIFRSLKEKDLITLRGSEHEVLGKINDVIMGDMLAEDKLDEDARKMMDQYRPQIQSGQMDERKLFLMIKKQIAKDRKIIL